MVSEKNDKKIFSHCLILIIEDYGQEGNGRVNVIDCEHIFFLSGRHLYHLTNVSQEKYLLKVEWVSIPFCLRTVS